MGVCPLTLSFQQTLPLASLSEGLTYSKACALTAGDWPGEPRLGSFLVSDPTRLVKCLWSLFGDDIATGEPVFFCFSQETLAEQFKKFGIAAVSPLEVVCAAARECFEVEDDFAVLKSKALTPGPDGQSMAIVLVCQQVLAVEEMVNEGGRFSENAYFPRLRVLMAANLPVLRMNPFEFDEFEAIWRTFAREIVHTAGGTEASITFEFDTYSGVNKARLFPMSQALLSKADLDELRKRCRSSYLLGISARDTWEEIRRERNHLTRRGQRLINSGFLRERVIQQVQHYAQRMATASAAGSVESTQKPLSVDLAIALDVADWFTEEYVAFLVEKGGARRIDDPDRLKAKLDAVLTERGYIFLALGEFGDYWLFREDAIEAEAGDVLLLVGTAFGFQKGVALLDGLRPPVAVDQLRARTLGGAPKIRVCQVVLPASLGCRVELRSGRLLKGDTDISVHSRYEWIGGICVDIRSRKYLRVFLPTEIRFDTKVYEVEALRRVNGIPMTWATLVKSMDNLNADSSYELQFPDGHSAKLAVGVDKSKERVQMGFLVRGDGLLSPTLEQIGESDAAIVGFTQPSTGVVAAPTIRQVACLLRDLTRRNGRPISPEECGRLAAGVSRSLAPDAVKRVLGSLIRVGAIVSEETLSTFP
jgi:hypothetical protein